MTAIDVGSGSGILSIACWRLGARKVYARDVDPATLEEARRNFELNGVEEGAIELSSGDGLIGLPVAADLIVANILLEELLRLIPDIRAHLKDGGVAIFSGLILKEKESFLDALQRTGFYALDELEKEEWWGVAAARSA
jgi:ribosomal protein L11 methyltransferase